MALAYEEPFFFPFCQCKAPTKGKWKSKGCNWPPQPSIVCEAQAPSFSWELCRGIAIDYLDSSAQGLSEQHLYELDSLDGQTVFRRTPVVWTECFRMQISVSRTIANIVVNFTCCTVKVVPKGTLEVPCSIPVSGHSWFDNTQIKTPRSVITTASVRILTDGYGSLSHQASLSLIHPCAHKTFRHKRFTDA